MSTPAPAPAPDLQTPFAVDDMLCFAAYSASLAFSRFYKPMLDRMGLTYPQFLVLSLLWREDDQTVGRLGERLFLESNTLTPLIKRLEAADLVTRARDAADERVVRVRLTDNGRALAVDAGCLAQAVMERTDLTPETMVQLRDGLAKLRNQLRLGAQAMEDDGQHA
ncbi:MarR family winged helix-turn-helix transcriptional regulator [Brevundimonas sp. SL130]|uniref:MarR family winged helix-turn-helix transcriptional regulator n=1 Tax=Brevundimonas sp. SL130 TaxID=2995143 RepID=UPI00226D07A9|nr:MarR family winged helix-turn-helix transcriptional regulator [Brevundimonas sp. SL130]WAC60068.1 MarR family winged helix-turn-helix transcriptional regulator [Brevundimonas sp. SL130]